MTFASASFDEQYHALTNGLGVVELNGWSSVTILGADRHAFLHNFCTNDIKRLQPGQSCEAFVTNVKGKIVGHGLVTCRDRELVMVGVPGQATPLIEHLDRYVIREDVQLRDTSEERRYLLVAGEFERAARAAFTWGVIRRDAATLLESTPREVRSVQESLGGQGFLQVGMEALNAARIEAGVPMFRVDFDEQNFPQEASRDREAISFTKGCYLGQETVARIDALGHVNQRLVGVRFVGDQLPHAGSELFRAGKTVGRVTSVAISPQLNGPLALGMVRREANAPGTRLDSPAGACEVVSLPLPVQTG